MFKSSWQVGHTVKVGRYGFGPWQCAAGYRPLHNILLHNIDSHLVNGSGYLDAHTKYWKVYQELCSEGNNALVSS